MQNNRITSMAQQSYMRYSHNLTSASREELTARDNSMGSSGGTTDVNIKVHSKKSLYLFLLGSSVPEYTATHAI